MKFRLDFFDEVFFRSWRVEVFNKSSGIAVKTPMSTTRVRIKAVLFWAGAQL